MKYFSLTIFLFLFLYFLGVSTKIFSQINANKTNSLIDYVKICKWKNDANSCVNFSFYDNCKTHKRISEILDKYSFRSTFFVISGDMLTDSLRDILKHGHEVGNHTYSHANLIRSDSTEIDFQIRKGKELIENQLGIKCVSFAEPSATQSLLSLKIALKYHLFIRNYFEYPSTHVIYPISKETIKYIEPEIKKSIINESTFEIEAHGIDGDGFDTISKDTLIQLLDILKGYSQNGEVWFTTIKEGRSYENLYNEISIVRELHDDTLFVTFNGYNKLKYKDLTTSLISFEIPYIVSNDIKCLSEFVEIRKNKAKNVITIDLKKDTVFKVILPDFKNQIFAENCYSVYPNPVSDYLYIRSTGTINSCEIFDNNGHNIGKYKTNRIDISRFNSGMYYVKMTESKNNKDYVTISKFLKR